MKTNLILAITNTLAFGITLIILKGRDYEWLLPVAVFAVTSFIFGYFFKNNEKGSG
tara:strand:+ start:21 stop:188 length:168 start_codon:yes stop_codon:yes gene_type:complete